NILIAMTAQLYFPTTTTGTAFGVPINTAIERMLASARELSAAAEKTPARADQGFGLKLAQAVKNRVASARPCSTAIFANSAVAPKAEDETFAEQLKKAVEERSGQK